MEIEKKPILIRSFHYDMLKDEEAQKPQQEIQVAMRRVTMQNMDGSEDDGHDKGYYFEVMVPFEIIYAPARFKVSGQITQVAQLIDFYGEAQELPHEELENLSRPLVEEVEKLTYEVTKISLGEGIKFNFASNPSSEEK